MGIYGNVLNFFSEQFRQFDYFYMKPQVNASYSTRENLMKVRGVFQFMKKGELLREEETLADVNVPTFWTKTKLKMGDYFIQKDDDIYRIKNSIDYLFEGGFCCYILEEVVGNTDNHTPFEYVNLGQDNYD